MKRTIISFCLATMIASGAPGQEVDREKLQSLIGLPRIDVELFFGFTYKRGTGIKLIGDDRPWTGDIDGLIKGMKGDLSDAPKWAHIGQIYSENNEPDKAHNAFEKAVAIYRPLNEKDPSNGAMAVELAEALSGVGKTNDAEALLRKLAIAGVKDWRTWCDLGGIVFNRASETIYGKTSPVRARLGIPSSYGNLPNQTLAEKPDVTKLDEAEKYLSEAAKCLDNAIGVAPNLPSPYEERAGFRAFAIGYLRSVIEALRLPGSDANARMARVSESYWKVLTDKGVLTDLHMSAELQPGEFRPVGIAALIDVVASALKNGRTEEALLGIDPTTLPDEVKRSIKRATPLLDSAVSSSDAIRSTEAAVISGYLHWMQKDRKTAIKVLSRVLESSSSNQQIRKNVIGMLVVSQQFDELAVVFEKIIKLNDSAPNRYILAKAYQRLNRWDKAEAQIESAVYLDPKDFTAGLARAAIAIRKANDMQSFQDAAAKLNRAYELFPKEPDATQWMDYALLRAIALALTGQPAEARDGLKDLLKHDPENETAKRALEIIGP